MRRVTPFRAASVLLAIFCVMHTAGGMLAQKSLGLASDAVFEAMKRVHFTFNGADCTWYGFWFGFGLTASVFLLLSSILAWQLETIPADVWPRLRVTAWSITLAQVANTILSWKYFFAGPGVFGILISVLLVAGIMRQESRVSAAVPS